MRVVFSAKGFVTDDRQIVISVYHFNGQLIEEKNAVEVGNLGVYYADFNLNPSMAYIVIAKDLTSPWKGYTLIGGKKYVDENGISIYDAGQG